MVARKAQPVSKTLFLSMMANWKRVKGMEYHRRNAGELNKRVQKRISRLERVEAALPETVL
jgi:hypothetical protein